MWLADNDSYGEIHPGDILTDFWGEKFTFLLITRAPTDSSNGKVYVEDKHGHKREFYPSVFDARIAPESVVQSYLEDELRAEIRREHDLLNEDLERI